MQGKGDFSSDAVAEGKSEVSGVTYNTRSGAWEVKALQRWGVKRRKLAGAPSREEAGAIAKTSFPRLVAAAADGMFDDEFSAAKAEIKAQVQSLWIP